MSTHTLTNSEPTTLHQAAMDLVESGFAIFPLWGIANGICTCPKGALCDQKPGKHPITRHGFQDATTDLGQVTAWWTEHADSNIGLPTGATNGIVVIDIDGDKGRAALETLPLLTKKSWVARTGRGQHVFFKHPGGRIGNRAGLRPGIDVRGDGGYVVAPPSRHVSGTTYAWVPGRAPGDVELAEMPDWLTTLLREPERNTQASAETPRPPERWETGTRNDRLWKLARSLALQQLPSALIAQLVRTANEQHCIPPLPDSELADILTRAPFAPHREDFRGGSLGTPPERIDPDTVEPLGIGAGSFLTKQLPPVKALVEGVLNDDGSGWIGGEEKLGKTFYALEEALCLALGLKVCDRFAVSEPVPVLFIEEEDSERRTQNRLMGLLRGHGLDPADPRLQSALDERFFVAVWAGFSFDVPARLAALEARIISLRPKVIYIDVLRKVTYRDLNKQDQAAMLLAELDRLRRDYGCVFRVLHHFRKSQGFRSGRGSQEIGGSFVLGAWAENSIFFEPTARKSGAPAAIDVQLKDGDPVPRLQMRVVVEGPKDAQVVRLVMEEAAGQQSDARAKVAEALGTLGPVDEPKTGDPGVSVATLVAHTKLGDKTVRLALKALEKDGVAETVGHAAKGKALWSLVTDEPTKQEVV